MGTWQGTSAVGEVSPWTLSWEAPRLGLQLPLGTENHLFYYVNHFVNYSFENLYTSSINNNNNLYSKFMLLDFSRN